MKKKKLETFFENTNQDNENDEQDIKLMIDKGYKDFQK